ncbi:tetratricopeptide repeat protein [Geomonas sp. Red69]|uniref:Tetratricopeptide repeat protein n=1 Tax=Geomonas diazotrophica TaxID=2843197 RepID=A0ABX8JDQ5_9BACT|nr:MULTISPECIES: tetratricopeptide repeat protein [Geomonas]MBU5637897.1 tetratricopeptide repeat protein [Geomonas diazotrophica]QWV96529.1 tetratricopeptide repeat protein [Geomonas nitrogeniifigens]QXE85634.1 tetratricopeptide repeat protein [Geomonas nitrogeniifigens]
MKNTHQSPLFRLAPMLIIVFATLAVYLPILHHNFQIFWDDAMYVTQNEAAKGLSLAHVLTAFTTNYAGNFAPVHIISYMLDYSIWGSNPKGYFLSNIIIHIMNGILLYRLLANMNWHKPAALLSVFIFLLHPVQVESVAWISERKNLLAMFFSLLSFTSYIEARKHEKVYVSKAYWISLACFILALLSKSVAVIMPCIFMLYDICTIQQSSWRKTLQDKAPFLVAATAMAWITIQYQAHGDIPGVGGGRVGYHGGSALVTGLTMLTVLPQYLKLLFWPTGLSAVYDPVLRVHLDSAVLLGGTICALLACIGIFLFLRSRDLFFWYAVFFIGLLPVSQIIPLTTLMNDRYLYFPMLGAAPLLGRLIISSKLPRQAAIPMAATITAILVLLTSARIKVWQNDLTLWTDTADKAPKHPVALYGKAQALQNAGNLDAALPLYLDVLKVAPRHADTLLHLAALYKAKNLPLQSRQYLLKLASYYPNFAQAFLDLGMNYYETGELEESKRNLERALVLQPNSIQALKYLGIICLRTRQFHDAERHLSLALSQNPADAVTAYNLACVKAQQGKPEEAILYLSKAVNHGFSSPDAIETDQDLDPIRSSPGFQELLHSLRK